MIAPDINAAPVCCAKCRQPVQITCPEHGTACVLELQPLPGHALATRAKPSALRPPTPSRTEASGPRPALRASRAGGNSLRQRMVAMASVDHARPTITQDVVDALAISPAHAAVELAFLTKKGLLVRVKRGQYVRAVEGIA